MLVARGVESRWHTVAGQSLHAYSLAGTGTGPPIVLVHGLGGSANGFSRTFFPLARRFRHVHAVDLPGHGFSPEFCGGPTCVNSQLQVLRAYCREVVRAPAFIVGNSLGGAMCVALAHESAELFVGLGLVAPAGADLGAERLLALLASFDVRTAAQAREMTRRLFHKPPLGALLLSSEIVKFYGTHTVRALAADAAATRASLTPEMLQGLKMPTLLIWGESEKVLPYEGLDYFRAHLPAHSRIEVVPGFGHMPQMERPEALVALLARFADGAGW